MFSKCINSIKKQGLNQNNSNRPWSASPLKTENFPKDLREISTPSLIEEEKVEEENSPNVVKPIEKRQNTVPKEKKRRNNKPTIQKIQNLPSLSHLIEIYVKTFFSQF